jgi:hypothetical protein
MFIQTQVDEDYRAPMMSKSDDVDIERSEEHADGLAVNLFNNHSLI